jgi:hypothetical protein
VTSSKPSSKWTAVKAALFVVAILALAFTIFRSYPQGSVTGDIRSTGAPHGDFIVRPVTCFSGGHWGFDGVWVVTETLTSGDRTGFKGGLKIMSNGAGGWDAYAENPNICQGFKCQQRHIDVKHCRVHDLVVSDMSPFLRTSGHATFDCAFPEGGTLKAALTFDGCAEVPSDGGDADL